MSRMDDLPNEILDEIFGHVNSVIGDYFRPITRISTVCRRWNRPMMTQEVWLDRIPRNADLQAKFPRLAFLTLRKSKHGLFFNGHTFIKKLVLSRTRSYSYITKCPSLTWLELTVDVTTFFNESGIKNLTSLLSLSQSLVHLKINVSQGKSCQRMVHYNEQMAKIIQQRPAHYQGFTKLRSLFFCIPHVDFVLFCSLFTSSSLESFGQCRDLKSVERVRQFFALFPNLSSINGPDLDGVLLQGPTHDHVTNLEFSKKSTELVRFSSICRQFPQLESLDTNDCEMVFDLTHPNHILNLKMSLTLVFPAFEMFPCLQEVELTLRSENLNIMHELGIHCPRLTKLRIELISQFGPIPARLDDIEFPFLKTFYADGDLDLDSSFTRFVAKLSNLESLDCSTRKPSHDFEVVQSDEILWPHLTHLRLSRVNNESGQRCLHWFVKNAPKLSHLDYDMGSYQPSGNDCDIVQFCPKLKSFRVAGHVSNKSLKNWTQGGSWATSLVNLHLSINFDPADLGLLYQFVGSLPRLQLLWVTCMLVGPIGDFEKNGFHGYYKSCYPEWDESVGAFRGALYKWMKQHYSYETSTSKDNGEESLATIFKNIASKSKPRVVARFDVCTSVSS